MAFVSQRIAVCLGWWFCIYNRIETDGGSSVGHVPWVIKVKRDAITKFGVAQLLHWSITFDTVADNIDAFVPCWQETLYNPDSATRSDVLYSAAVQLQCGRYVSICDPSVFQSSSSHSACLHIRAGRHDRRFPFDHFRTLHCLMTCRLLFTSPSYAFIKWGRINLVGK
jgi:hypothetical protein